MNYDGLVFTCMIKMQFIQRRIKDLLFLSVFSQNRYDGTSDLATVESYDPVTNVWQPEVSMGTRRSCLGVAVLHGLLYAAGGYDGASCLNRYAIQSNKCEKPKNNDNRETYKTALIVNLRLVKL